MAFESVREFAFAERFTPNHSEPKTRLWRAVRGKRFKLIRNVLKGRDRLFDLDADPHELSDLLAAGEPSEEAQAARARLGAALEALAGE